MGSVWAAISAHCLRHWTLDVRGIVDKVLRFFPDLFPLFRHK